MVCDDMAYEMASLIRSCKSLVKSVTANYEMKKGEQETSHSTEMNRHEKYHDTHHDTLGKRHQ